MLFVNAGKASLYARLCITLKIAYKFFKSTQGWYIYPGDKVTSTITIDIK